MSDFARVAIVLDPLTPGGKEYIVLESQLLGDFGGGQGPKGGVVTVENGWMAVRGAGDARLEAGQDFLPGGAFPPRLTLVDLQHKLAVEIAAHDDPTPNPSQAKVYLGGAPASLRMRDVNGNDHVLLAGAAGDLWLGGKAAAGDIVLFSWGEEDNRNKAKGTIHLDGNAGSIRLRDASGNVHALLTSAGNLWLGGKEEAGDIFLFASGEEDNHNTAKATIHLNGNKGDIILRNADCAEDFDVDDMIGVEPGTVMVINAGGRLQPSALPYDRRVAGVVSGAGDCRAGIVLDRRADGDQRLPVALVGKVHCKVDATSAPISVGDLLTTSSTLGHAMKAEDPLRAFGAVIGKALASFQVGTGLVPILVALQ
jgi:hypothetical protein